MLSFRIRFNELMSLLINYNVCGHVEPVFKYIYMYMRVFKFDQLMYFEYINYCQLIEKTIFVEYIKPLAKKNKTKFKKKLLVKISENTRVSNWF